MPPYILTRPTASDVPRLADIQRAAFMNAPVTLGAHDNVSQEDYISWASKVISRAHAPPGCKVEFVCAKDVETGWIVGWAEWAMPLDEGEEPKEGGEKEKIPYPEGGNEDVWNELLLTIAEYEKRTIGDRKHWCTSSSHHAVLYFLAHSLPQPCLFLLWIRPITVAGSVKPLSQMALSVRMHRAYHSSSPRPKPANFSTSILDAKSSMSRS
jgi:hypothetical protein